MLAMLHHGPSRADLVRQAIDRIRDEQQAAKVVKAQAEDAKHRAEDAVLGATAQVERAETTIAVLGLQLDQQLEALHDLIPEPRRD